MGITPRQFEEIQRRIDGVSRRAPTPVRGSEPRVRLSESEIILGIDPSLRGTGFGVLRLHRSSPEALAHGTIRCPANWERSRCFVRIAETLRDILKVHRPNCCVVEGLFYAQNLKTALLMGEARGAILLIVAEAGLPIYEIAPRKVKQAIVGYGAAQKTAVAKMVQRLLHLAEPPAPDAADALALALTRAHEQNAYSLTPTTRL